MKKFIAEKLFNHEAILTYGKCIKPYKTVSRMIIADTGLHVTVCSDCLQHLFHCAHFHGNNTAFGHCFECKTTFEYKWLVSYEWKNVKIHDMAALKSRDLKRSELCFRNLKSSSFINVTIIIKITANIYFMAKIGKHAP